ncbi:MAG: HAMP domain-containing sensor histidine kinase [Planctomycetaceae bacterium]
MKRSSHIWTLFGLCLVLLLSGLGWLSAEAIQLDRDQMRARRDAEQARRRAERQEVISNALWRLDSKLTPLIVREAIRPAATYRAVSEVPSAKGAASRLASVVLTQRPRFVLLHFEVGPDGKWTSPQYPDSSLWSVARATGRSMQDIQQSGRRLEVLRDLIDHPQLLAMLPVESLTRATTDENAQTADQLGPPLVVQNSVSSSQQLEIFDDDDPSQQSGDASQTANRPALSQTSQRQTIVDDELLNRLGALQSIAQSQLEQQRANGARFVSGSDDLSEGVSQGMWIQGRLLLARRVTRDSEEWVQGCWIDWEQLKQHLLGEVDDLLPQADLVGIGPEADVRSRHLLATLPVQLTVPAVPLAAADVRGGLSPIGVSLAIAWTGLVLVAIAAGVLLWGVMALSERRGAFVAAVTHELRTPLTTFRLYTEMLGEGMITDAGERKRYLETLRVESERLTHLVDNVLAYSRLERVRHESRSETLATHALLHRMRSRLEDRATQAGMRLDWSVPDALTDVMLHTDPVAVEQIVFNLVDNACKYACAGEKWVRLSAEQRGTQELCVEVCDGGPGISDAAAKRLFRPFSKSVDQAAVSAPGVGLGLALSRRLARTLGGRLELTLVDTDDPEGVGARFVLSLPVATPD